MISKRIWIVASMLLVMFSLVSCGASDEEKASLLGHWQLNNLESILGDQAVDLAEFDEYLQMAISIDFNSDDTFSFEIAIEMDMPAMLADMMGDELEIEAEVANINISLNGTYEIPSSGNILLTFDRENVSVTPDEFCFTVAGFETCQSAQEFSAGFEEFDLFQNEAGFFEVDANSLTMWDSECDYPADTTCAAIFTR